MSKIVNLNTFQNFDSDNLPQKKKHNSIFLKSLNQRNLIEIFNTLIKRKKSSKNFKKQKLILYLLNNFYFKKKLNSFLKLNFLSQNFKKVIKFNRRQFLLKIKLKKIRKYKKKRKKLRKKLDTYLKFLLLNNYSLLNKFKKNKIKCYYKKKKKKHLLFISIRSNNIFINLFCYKKKKLQLLNFWSCGLFKLHCTKRKLKFVIYTMLKEIKKKIKYLSFFIIKIFCAHFLHKFLYRNFKKLFLRSRFIIFNSFKIFNGCRSKKKRRKKHLRFRVLR